MKTWSGLKNEKKRFIVYISKNIVAVKTQEPVLSLYKGQSSEFAAYPMHSYVQMSMVCIYLTQESN